MEPFKNVYNPRSIRKISKVLYQAAGGDFDQMAFENAIIPKLPSLEMKDRVRLISQTLKETLPGSYKKQINILNRSLAKESELKNMSTHEQDAQTGLNGFLIWPLCQYIEDYGLEDFDTSFKGMYQMTKRFTAEFAIRPFLQADDKYVFRTLRAWKKDKSEHVRRLCSEGVRPNLPWGRKVQALEDDLERNIRLIDSLKDDDSQYVRTSVANHLKDISALDSKLMLATCHRWNKGRVSPERQWVLRRASQNLLKKGNKQALKLHGYTPNAKFEITDFSIQPKIVHEGGSFDLHCQIKNLGKKEEKVLVEYVIYYLKKDGSHSPKPFRLRDTLIQSGASIKIDKKIHCKKVTTRKHYKGLHKVSLQINGKESATKDFMLE